MNYPDIMLDLETLGTRPGCKIISIGAVAFGPKGLGKEFYCTIKREGQGALHEDPSTVQWWENQGEAAKKVFENPTHDLKEGLEAFSAYLIEIAQSIPGKTNALRVWGNGANFDQPMGMANSPDKLAVGTRRQIWFHREAHEFAGRLGEAERGSTCYVARSSIVTGNIHVHDMAFGVRNDEQTSENSAFRIPHSAFETLWVANTLFSCLCTLDEAYNFVPGWKPP